MYRMLLVVVLFSVGCTPQQVRMVCPQLKQYSAETQAVMKMEFEEVKQKYPAITQFVADHYQLRNVIRQCQKGERSG